MSEYSWILHRYVINNHDIICEDMNQKSGAKSRLLTAWVEKVTVDEHCYLRTEKYILYGPLKKRDNLVDYVIVENSIFIFDTSFEKPEIELRAKTTKKDNKNINFEKTEWLKTEWIFTTWITWIYR